MVNDKVTADDSGHLPESKPFAISLFSNAELIDINQNSSDNKIIDASDSYPIWYARVDKKEYYAFFNIEDSFLPKEFAFNTKGKKAVEVWSGKQFEPSEKLCIKVPRHSVKLIRVEE